MISESENCPLCRHELKYLEDRDSNPALVCLYCPCVHCSKGFRKVVIRTGLFRSEDILALTEDVHFIFWPSFGSDLGPVNDLQQLLQPASKTLLFSLIQHLLLSGLLSQTAYISMTIAMLLFCFGGQRSLLQLGCKLQAPNQLQMLPRGSCFRKENQFQNNFLRDFSDNYKQTRCHHKIIMFLAFFFEYYFSCSSSQPHYKIRIFESTLSRLVPKSKKKLFLQACFETE